MAALTPNRIGYAGATIPSHCGVVQREANHRFTSDGVVGPSWGGEEFRRHFNAVKYRLQHAVESCLVLRHQLLVPV